MPVQPASLANLKLHPQWVKGQSGNPGGKPVAARNKIQAKFLNALLADFEKYGAQAIAECRIQDPTGYVRAIVALMPKEIEVTRQFEDLTDEQLAAAVTAARALADAVGVDPGEGASLPDEHQPAENVPALRETS